MRTQLEREWDGLPPAEAITPLSEDEAVQGALTFVKRGLIFTVGRSTFTQMSHVSIVYAYKEVLLHDSCMVPFIPPLVGLGRRISCIWRIFLSSAKRN